MRNSALDDRNMKGERLSDLCTGRLYPQCRFLLLTHPVPQTMRAATLFVLHFVAQIALCSSQNPLRLTPLAVLPKFQFLEKELTLFLPSLFIIDASTTKRMAIIIGPTGSRCSTTLADDNLENLIQATSTPNSVALVRERTIPTERPPPVGEVSANFCG